MSMDRSDIKVGARIVCTDTGYTAGLVIINHLGTYIPDVYGQVGTIRQVVGNYFYITWDTADYNYTGRGSGSWSNYAAFDIVSDHIMATLQARLDRLKDQKKREQEEAADRLRRKLHADKYL